MLFLQVFIYSYSGSCELEDGAKKDLLSSLNIFFSLKVGLIEERQKGFVARVTTNDLAIRRNMRSSGIFQGES